MTRGSLITIGTTAANLLSLLRGLTPPAGASISKSYGSILADQCRELTLKVDTGTVYLGPDSDVTSTNYSNKLLAGESIRLADAEANSLNLSDIFLIGGAASQKISVQFTTI